MNKFKEHALAAWNFDTLPGNNPLNWPQGLDKFIEKLESLPMLSLFSEPFDLHNQFKSRFEQFIGDTLTKIKAEKEPNNDMPEAVNLREALYAFLLVAFHTGSFVEIMNAIRIMHEAHKQLANINIGIAEGIATRLAPAFEEIKQFAEKSSYLHHVSTLSNEGGFKISSVNNFQKQSFLNSSMTTDGTYLYIYISAVNGGMYKIGTGENDTVPGRIYLYAAVAKLEEVSWVYVKGKLYLRNSTREFGTLEIIDPETFKLIGLVQVHCPEIFGHQSLQMINKHFPLLTDGQYLYIIGKKLLSEKIGSDKTLPPEEQKLSEQKLPMEKSDSFIPLPKPLDSKQNSLDVQLLEGSTGEIPKSSEIKPEGDVKPQSGETKPEQKSEGSKVESESSQTKEIKKEEENKVAEEKAEEKKSEDKKPAEQQSEEKKPEEQGSVDQSQQGSKPKDDKEPQPVVQKPIEKVDKKELIQGLEPNKSGEVKERLRAMRKKKEVGKTKKETKDDADSTLKLCEYVLFEFDTEKTSGHQGLEQDENIDKMLVQELFEAFNGYFTIEECIKALSYSKEDMQTAALWLTDEGEKERSKLTIFARSQTLLAQAEVISDISTKNLKNNAELVTKDNSLIFPNQVSQCNWTMNSQQVTLYSENGIEIFSKNPDDVHILDDISRKEKHQAAQASLATNLTTTNWASFQTGTTTAQKVPAGFSHGGPTSTESFGKPTTTLFGSKPPNTFEKPLLKESSNFGRIPENAFKYEVHKIPSELPVELRRSDLLQPATKTQEPKNIASTYSTSYTATKKVFQPEKTEQKKKPEEKKEEKKDKTEPAEEEKAKKPKFQLRGTYLKSVYPERKCFYQNSSIHMCYDPIHKKFYAFNWIAHSNSNIFPSLITISYDNLRYEQSSLHSLPNDLGNKIGEAPIQSLKDLSNQILYGFMAMQPKRFALPWRVRNWEYVYGMALNDLTNPNKKPLPGSLGGGGGDLDEAEKKRIASQKSKLTQRLNKFLEVFPIEETGTENSLQGENSTKKNLRELRKDYAFSIDGSYDSLKLFAPYVIEGLEVLLQQLSEEKLEIIQDNNFVLLLQLLLYWVKHSDFVFLYQLEKADTIEDLEKAIYSLLSSEKITQELLKTQPPFKCVYSLVWRILINGWDLFARTSKRMYKWLTLIFHSSRNLFVDSLDEDPKLQYDSINSENLSPVVYFYLKYGYYPDTIKPEFPLRDYQVECVKKQANFFNPEPQSDSVFVKRSLTMRVRESTLIEPYGRLLLHDLKYLEEVKPQEANFEFYFPNYFIEENKPKIEPKPEEEKIPEKSKDKKGKGKKDQKKEKDLKKEKGPVTEAPIKASSSKKNSVNIDPEVLKSHQEQCEKFWVVLEENLLKAVDAPSFENLCVVKIFFKLYLDSMVEFEKIENDETEWIYKRPFAVRLTSTLVRIIEALNNKINDPSNINSAGRGSVFYPKLCELLSTFVSSITYLVYQSCITKNFGSEELGHLFVNLIEQFSKLSQITGKNGETFNLLDHILPKSTEGVDHLNEKVFETNHPYERGKHQSFEPCSYPGALAISVELDKRCQSDQTQDFLTITSWYNSQFSTFGYFMSHRDNVGTSFRISGKPNMKKPLLLIGNNIQIDFSSSPHSKDEHSLNRWGFKVRIKPIYRFSRFMLKNSNLSGVLRDVEARFGGSKNFKIYLSAMTLSTLVALEIAEAHLKGNPLSKEEKKLNNYLNWNIIKSGLGSVAVSEFLTKKDDLYHFIEPHKYVSSEDQPIDDEYDQLKEDIYSRIAKVRIALEHGDDGNKEGGGAQVHFQISNPLLKTCLQEIEEQKGEFFNVVATVRSKVREPLNLTAEKRRPNFKPEFKKLWDKAESFTILTLIYHSGLLKFINEEKGEEHTADQIRQIGTTRNEVLSWMLNQVQSEKEWQFLVEEISECRNKYLQSLRDAEEAKKKEAQEASKTEKEEEKKKQDQPKAESKVEIKKIGGKIVVSTGAKKKKASKLLPKRTSGRKESQNPYEDEEEKKESESEEETKSQADDNKKAKTVKSTQPDFDEKMEEKTMALLTERYVGNNDALKMICNLKNINQNQEVNNILKDVLISCKATLSAFKKEESTQQFILQFKSPYEIVANHVISACNLLLKLSSNVGKSEELPQSPKKSEDSSKRLDSIIDDLLEPMVIKAPQTGRSLSTNVESQIEDKKVREKLNLFREWVDTYKKWKEWQMGETNEDEYFYSKTANPLKAIVALIKSRVNAEEMEICLKNQLTRSGLRIIGLQLCCKLLDKLKATPFARYFIGVFTQQFIDDYLANIACTPESFKSIINELVFEITCKLIQNFSVRFEDILEVKLKNLSILLNKIRNGTAQASDWEGLTEQYMVDFSNNLRDLTTLLANEKITSQFVSGKKEGEEEEEEHPKIFNKFLEHVFQVLLFCHSFQYLSLHFEHIALISQTYIQNVALLVTKLKNLGNTQLHSQIVSTLLTILKKELGVKNPPDTAKYSLNARVLHKCNDIISIERINSLLYNVYDVLSGTTISKLQQSVLKELGFISYFIIYQHEAPSVIAAATKVAEIVSENVKLDQLVTPYDIDYMYYFYKDYETLQKGFKAQTAHEVSAELFEIKGIPVHVPKSSLQNFRFNNYFAILEKLGRLLLNQKDEGLTFRNVINNDQVLHRPMNDEKEKKTIVMLHLANEEDLSFLVKVFYYWEELYPTFSKKYPQTYENYKKHKESQSKKEQGTKSKSAGDKSFQGQNQSSQGVNAADRFRTHEKLFLNIPDVNLISLDEKELNVGWEFDMLGNLNDCKGKRLDLKRTKTKKSSTKKVWTNATLAKLEKKFEEAAKSIEEPKEEQSIEDKNQIVKAKCFVDRMQRHLNEALQACGILNLFGFTPILTEYPHEKALELANLINLGLQNKLKPINVDHFKEDIRKKVDPNNLAAPDQKPPTKKGAIPAEEKPKEPARSQLVISVCDSSIMNAFEYNYEFVASLSPFRDSFYTDANKVTVIHQSIRSGNSTSLLVNNLINFLRSLLSNQEIREAVIPQIMQYFDFLSEKKFEELEVLDRQLLTATFVLIGGWVDLPKVGSDIAASIDIPASCMTQGGTISGKKTCTLIAKNDPSINVQNINLDQIRVKLQVQWPQDIAIKPQKLITALNKVVDFYNSSSKASREEYFIPSVMLRAFLKACSTMDWIQMLRDPSLDKHQIIEFIKLLFILSENCPVDRSADFYDKLYTQAWESYIDKQEPHNHVFCFPKSFSSPNVKRYDFEEEPPKKINDSAEAKQEISVGPADTALPQSYYISSLPESTPQVADNKLLKYWEKHILPRIHDFVRSSLKEYEIKDFFEQMRQPLRKGDQAKAAEVAYIICDQRLPNGVVLPDANHDWSSITAEEISLGTWAIASITNKQRKLYSPFFSYQKGLGNSDVPVLILALDTKSSSVLVSYNDWDNNQLVSVWLPVTALKFPDISMPLPAASFTFNQILDNYSSYSKKSVALSARSVLLRFFDHNTRDIEVLKRESELLHEYNLSLVDLITWSVLDELGDDSVEGWLKINGWEISAENQSLETVLKKSTTTAAEIVKLAAASRVKPETKNTPKLHALQQYLNYKVTFDQDKDIEKLLSWLSSEFEKMVNYINKNKVSFELQNPPHQHENNHTGIYHLNSFLPSVMNDDSISGLTLSFLPEASLCMCAGVKFYNDPIGVNIIHHLAAGKDNRTKLPSLIFNQSNVWFSYYFNAESLPIYLQTSVSSHLPATVYAIPSRWSVCFWIADALTNAQVLSKKKEHLEMMKKIIQILVAALKGFEGPLNLKHFIYILFNRVIKKVRYLAENIPEYSIIGKNLSQDEIIAQHFNIIGLDKGWIKTLIEHAKSLKEAQQGEVLVLYSSYTQEIIELIVNCLVPLNSFSKPNNVPPKLLSELNVPDWLLTIVNIAIFTQYFKGEGVLSDDLLKESLNSIRLEGQWDKILLIKDLPSEWSVGRIKDLVKETVVKNHGRILIPSLDIYVPTRKLQEGDIVVEEHFGVCLVVIDGWSQLELEEENPEEGKEKEEEKEAERPMPMWVCEVCTCENPESASICDACESPKPAKKEEVVVLEEVKKADFSQLDVQVQQKEKENIQKMIEGIQENVRNYIASLKDQLAKLEEQEKAERTKLKEQKSKEKEVVPAKKTETDAEQKRLRNREKKLAIKEAKRKEQEEKRMSRDLRKKLKQMGQREIEEEEKEKKEEVPKQQSQQQHDEKPESQDKTTEALTTTPKGDQTTETGEAKTETPQPEEKKSQEVDDLIEKDSPLDKLLSEKKDLTSYISTLKEPTIIAGRQILETPENSLYLEQNLRKRLTTEDGNSLNSEVIKVLGLILGVLKKKSSVISETYKKQFNFIDWDHITDLEESVFIEKIKNLIQANSSSQVWKFLETSGYDLWLNNSSFSLFIDEYQEFSLPTLKALEQLMSFMQKDLCNESKSVLTYPPVNIRILLNANRFSPSEEQSFNYQDSGSFNMKYSDLAKYSTCEIRYSWAIIKNFNKNLSDAILYINMISGYGYDLSAKWLNLGTFLSAFRNFWLSQIKIELSQRVLQKTALPRENVPKVTLERLRLVRENEVREKEEKAHEQRYAATTGHGATQKEIVSYKTKDSFVFTKAYEQLKDIPPTLFRPVKPLGTDPFIAFEIVFKGENVMGESGPYRQFFADISQELQPNNVSLTAQYKNLNLLCPSPNNASKVGEGRDKYVINPSAKGSYHLQLFEFLGILMGVCVRTDTHFTLDLPSIFWKQLTNQTITVEDLEEIDKPLVDLIRLMGECNKEVSLTNDFLFV